MLHKHYSMNTIKFLSSLELTKDVELGETAAIPGPPLLGMKSNWTWIRETDISFHAVSNLCYTLIIVVERIGEWWPVSHSATHNQMFTVCNRSGDYACHGSNPISIPSTKFRT